MITIIGTTVLQQKHKLTCHCGLVEILIELPEGIDEVGRCDCSICRRKGAVLAAVPINSLSVLKGKEHLTLYQFNTKTARHYFCSNCGIYTHHQSRLDPGKFDFNVGCLEGVNPLEIENIQVFDGVNHPIDRNRNWDRSI
jgi:hypothetical protein